MRHQLTALAFAFCLTSCVIYLDDPPLRSISGQIVRADTGLPVSGAQLWFNSGRKPFSLLPVDVFGDAFALTDAQGRFVLQAKLNSQVDVTVQDEEFIQIFALPKFPASNRIDQLVLSVSHKKPIASIPR